MVGLVHTHWNPLGQLSFSSGDQSSAATAQKAGYAFDWYLVNRNGEVLFMNPNKNKTAYNTPKNLFKIK